MAAILQLTSGFVHDLVMFRKAREVSDKERAVGAKIVADYRTQERISIGNDIPRATDDAIRAERSNQPFEGQRYRTRLRDMHADKFYAAARELPFLRERAVGFCRPILQRLLESFDPELILANVAYFEPMAEEKLRQDDRGDLFWIAANT